MLSRLFLSEMVCSVPYVVPESARTAIETTVEHD